MKIKINRKKLRVSEIVTQGILLIFLISLALVILVPFLFMISISFSTELSYIKYGMRLIPKEFTLSAYKEVLSSNDVLVALGNTMFITVIGTFLGTLITLLMAYPLSKREMPFTRTITFICFVSALFNGGIITTLTIVNAIGLGNSLWSLIIPFLVTPWYLIILRNFFAIIPKEIEEAASIDGASEFAILFKVLAPIARPGIMTVALFYSLAKWNEWFYSVLFISDDARWPIQVFIRNLFLSGSVARPPSSIGAAPLNETFRMAMIVFSIIPIMCVYPFLQKNFMKGLTMGAVKG